MLNLCALLGERNLNAGRTRLQRGEQYRLKAGIHLKRRILAVRCGLFAAILPLESQRGASLCVLRLAIRSHLAEVNIKEGERLGLGALECLIAELHVPRTWRCKERNHQREAGKPGWNQQRGQHSSRTKRQEDGSPLLRLQIEVPSVLLQLG